MGFRLDEDEAWAMIAEAHESVLTTLRRDGRPVALPVWHVAEDRAVYVRTPRRSKKVARVRNDSRGSFLVDAGEAWAELRAVVLPVRVTVVDDEAAAARARALLDAKYARFVVPPEELPPPVAAAYADMAVLRLDPNGAPLTWNNAALLGR